jgi:hypothetical protein
MHVQNVKAHTKTNIKGLTIVHGLKNVGGTL